MTARCLEILRPIDSRIEFRLGERLLVDEQIVYDELLVVALQMREIFGYGACLEMLRTVDTLETRETLRMRLAHMPTQLALALEQQRSATRRALVAFK